MPKTLDDCDNEFLGTPFIEEEIKNAIWVCSSSKGPGLDGFSFVFFKENWGMLKKELLMMME